MSERQERRGIFHLHWLFLDAFLNLVLRKFGSNVVNLTA